MRVEYQNRGGVQYVITSLVPSEKFCGGLHGRTEGERPLLMDG